MTISETWLNNTNFSDLPEYVLIGNDRGFINHDSLRDTRGGDVAFLASLKILRIGKVEYLLISVTAPIIRTLRVFFHFPASNNLNYHL